MKIWLINHWSPCESCGSTEQCSLVAVAITEEIAEAFAADYRKRQRLGPDDVITVAAERVMVR